MQRKKLFSAFFILIFVFGMFACNKPRTIIPQGILTEKEMVPLLVDIHIAQSASGLFPKDSVMGSAQKMLPYILSIHHVEKAVYDSSIEFYTRHPEMMQQMYDEVIDELSKEQGEASSK